MILFNGLEEILKCVIENTAYLDDSVEDTGQELKSDEERFANAMKAIFGPSWGDMGEGHISKCTVCSFSERMAIFKNHKENRIGMETAIKEFLAQKLGTDDENNTYFNSGLKTLKKHFQRNRKYYESEYASIVPSEYVEEMIADLEPYERQKTEIIAALRKADWPI